MIKKWKLALLVVLSGVCTSAALADVAYDSTVTPLPGNLRSFGAESTSFSEIGDAITLAGTARRARSVTITMSSWACEAGRYTTANCITNGGTFDVPIALNIYGAGSLTPGPLLATLTKTFTIPYRPSSDNLNCTEGRWYEASSGMCFNGLAHNVTFDLTPLNLTLPDSLVYGVSYNTTHYGPAPIGESEACYTSSRGCGYDALNVAVSSAVVAGTNPDPLTAYWESADAASYCDGGFAGVGMFRLDSPTSPCWVDEFGPQIPAAQFVTFKFPASKDDCKNNGWQNLFRADGSAFANQGACVSYAQNGK